MKTSMVHLRKLIDHWLLQLIVGSILLLSVFTELVGLHHGVFAMAIWHLLSAMPNILQALERILKKWKVKA